MQGIALGDALVTAARQADELVRTLKRQQRQERIVANTVASLKALHKAAGSRPGVTGSGSYQAARSKFRTGWPGTYPAYPYA